MVLRVRGRVSYCQGFFRFIVLLVFILKHVSSIIMRNLKIFLFVLFFSYISLSAKQTLKFKLVDQYYPLYYKNKEGKMTGMIFYLLNKWAQDHHYEISVEAIDYLDQSKIEDDVVYLGLTYNSDLSEHLYFKNEIGKCVTALVYNSKENQKITNPSLSKEFRVGVVKNSIYKDILKLHGHIDNVFSFSDTQQLFSALRDNKIDLIYGSYKSLYFLWHIYFDPSFLKVFNSDYFYSFGIRVAISKKAVNELKSLDIDLLSYMKALSKSEYASFKELDYLFNLDVGIYNDYPPLSFINSKGQLSGILVDLWNDLSREYAFSLKFVGFPKESIKLSLDDKDISVWGGIIEDNNILTSKIYKVTDPICMLDFNFYLTNSRNSDKILNSQIVDFHLSGIRLDKNTDIVNNFADIINNSYGFIENSITTNYLLRLHGYNNILKFKDLSFNVQKPLILASNIRKLQLFSYMLDALTSNILFDTLLEIDKNWFTQNEIEDYQSSCYSHVNSSNFNIEEKIWLEHNKKLNLAVKNWYPVDYVNSGRYKGINEWLIKKIKRLTNVDFNIINVRERELKDLIKNGQIDILSSNLDSANLDYFFNIKSVSGIPLYIFSQKTNLFIPKSSDRIAVLNFLYSNKLETQIGAQLVQVESFKEALDLIYKREVDGILSDEYTATVNFEDLNVRDLEKIVNVSDLSFNLNIAVYNQDYILRRIIQKILFRTNVNNKLYFDDWVFNVHESSKDMKLKKSGILVLAIVFFVLTILMFFLFRLLKEIGFRKKMYSSVISEKKVIEDAIVAKTIFLASMSHDIRTPINGIIAATELLDNTDLLGVQKEYVQMINYSSTSLLSLIDEILYISKIDMNGIYIENNEINLEYEIEEVVKSFQSQSAKHNLDLIFYSKSDLNNYLIGDRSRLKKVLINLISNAFKFTKEGIIIINYEIICTREGDNGDRIFTIEFKVIDTGKGIKKGNIPVIFELFKQGDDFDAKEYEGTGLGLAISRKLVSLMGGPGITVESEVGKGTTFSFMLPFVLGNEINDKEKSKFKLIRNKKILTLFSSNKAVVLLNEISEILDYKDNVRNFYSYEDAYEECSKYPYYDFIFINVDNADLQKCLKFAERLEKLNLDAKIVFVFYYLKNEEIIDFKYEYIQKPFKRWDFYSDWIINGSLVDAPLIDDSGIFKLKDNICILIAEDNEINQKILKNILIVIGVREDSIDIVDDGFKAIDYLKTNRYDIAFVDIRMPKCDGFTVSEEIRRYEKQNNLNSCVLIAVTAHALREYKDRCLESGMNDYLAKPIHIKSIKYILKKYLYIDEVKNNNIIEYKNFDKLDDLDINRALQDLDISYDMYIDLCRGFVVMSDNIIRDLDEAFNLNNVVLIKELAHSIAGALGNMRSNLFDDFKQIENGTDSIEELRVLYSKARQNLIMLVKNIRDRILNVVDIDDYEKLEFQSNNDFLIIMQKLLNEIENRNPKEYKKILETLKKYHWDDDNIVLFDSLVECLRVYNFKESVNIIKRMMSHNRIGKL